MTRLQNFTATPQTTTCTSSTIRKGTQALIAAYLLLTGIVWAGENQCVPTVEMTGLAASDGFELLGTLPGGSATTWVCGDVNADGRLDLCTALIKGATWKAGCFVSRGDRYKFESMLDSDEAGSHAISAKDLSLELIKKGSTVRWGSEVAELKLLRDCLSVETSESASRLYCYNGAYFLSMQMTD